MLWLTPDLQDNHRITESQNHRITESQNHRITESQNHRITEERRWLAAADEPNPSYQTRHHGLVRGSKRVGDIEPRAGRGVMLIPNVFSHGAGDHADSQQSERSNKERAGESRRHRLQR
ncbi:hypothetical protein C0073_009605 [Aeromonas veronii]|nr:hypothetical protein C0073_009605 [Aeromonas veronii]